MLPWSGLVVLCTVPVLLEATALRALGFESAMGLAPQVTGTAAYGVFHDLRWVLVYHQSWAALVGELVLAVLVRSVLVAGIVQLAWPADVPRPSWRVSWGRSSSFAAVTMLILSPWAVVAMAASETSLSWFLFGELLPVAVLAMALSRGGIEAGWWHGLPSLASIGWSLASFAVLTVAAPASRVHRGTDPPGTRRQRAAARPPGTRARVQHRPPGRPARAERGHPRGADLPPPLPASGRQRRDPAQSPRPARAGVLPTPGRELGVGIAAGWELRGMLTIARWATGAQLAADEPFVRSIIDHAPFYRNRMLCPVPGVRVLVFLPTVSAAVVPPSESSDVPSIEAPGLHASLLGRPFVQDRILAFLRGWTPANESEWYYAVIQKAAGAWQAPALALAVNPVWHAQGLPDTAFGQDGCS